jgi:type II secretory pathway pseudopilin PulG
MKKRRGFTLIELIVCVFVLIIVAILVLGAMNSRSSDNDSTDMSFLAPEVENARSQRRMADELARQNDLMQRRIELLEEQNNNKTER